MSGRSAVEGCNDTTILVGIERLVRLGVLAALAVPIGVENNRRPALGLLLIAGLVQDTRVDPADGAALRSTRTHPRGIVLVVTELHMMSREARVDQRVLLGFRIIDLKLAARRGEREDLRRRVAGAGLAPIRVVGRTDARGEPHPVLLIVVEAVRASLAVPNFLVA